MFHEHYFKFGPHSRLFEKGDIKYVILSLLKDKPSHGYEIIRALEERFHGFYSPSPGSVYPTLQMLEDMGYVTSAERDGKKVYTITDEGRKFLEEREDIVDRIKGHMKDWWTPQGREEFHETVRELRHIGMVIKQRFHRLDADKLSHIREVVSRACQDIEKIIEQA